MNDELRAELLMAAQGVVNDADLSDCADVSSDDAYIVDREILDRLRNVVRAISYDAGKTILARP
jgi:hypothetical protein